MLLLLAAYVSLIDSLFSGSDPIRRFTPADYNAAYQNWSSVQLDDGRLLIANTAGILVYDGARWSLIPLPEQRTVRSLHLGTDQKIWVGAENMIGHLEADLKSGFRFVTDHDDVKGDVWAIVSSDAGTIFQASDELVLVKDSVFTRKDHRSGAHPAMWNLQGVVIVQDSEKGWISLSGLNGEPVSVLNGFSGRRIVSILPESNEGWIVVTRDGEIHRVGTAGSELMRTGLPEIYSAKRLNDGTYAIGTFRNGVQMISDDFSSVTVPGQEIGLHLDAIWNIMEDHEGHVWLATDRGFIQLYRYPDLDYWDSRFGLVGNVQAIMRFQNRMVVGTSMGLFVESEDGFRSAASISDAVYHMMPHEGELWVATSAGIRIWDGRNPAQRHLVSVPTFTLKKDDRNPKTIWAGIASGLMILEFIHAPRKIPGVDLDVRNLAQEPDGTLWAGTFRGGVLRIGTDMRVSKHLESLGETRVVMHRDGLLAGTAEGLKVWNRTREQFENWGQTGSIGVYRMIAENDSSLWVVRFDNSDLWIENITTEGIVTEPYKRLPNRGILRLHVEGDALWVGSTSGLYRYDKTKTSPLPIQPKPVLHSLVIGNVTTLQFATPWFEDVSSIRYRYRLLGKTEWTEWAPTAESVFLDLWEGEYRFETQSKDKFGRISESLVVNFIIESPYYRTTLAYAIYLLLMLGVVFAAVLGSRSYTRFRTLRLEKLVRERTRQVNRQKEELIGTNRSLTSLIDQKNTILSIAAHDLKNPLATVQGFSELLSMTLEDMDSDLNSVRENLTEQVGYIRTASVDMLKIISDLIETAIAQKGVIAMNPKPFPLMDMAFTITSTYRTVAVKKGITLTSDIPADSMVAFADPDRMQEVFLNLVSNAVKYTKVGGKVKLSVLRREENGESQVGFRVEDQGPGFSEEDLQKMYGLFSRLSAQPTAGERSNGIGLYIVKQFTEYNKGSVDLTTVLGKGSTFTIWLPASET